MLVDAEHSFSLLIEERYPIVFEVVASDRQGRRNSAALGQFASIT
jgi:hypothetical protein